MPDGIKCVRNVKFLIVNDIIRANQDTSTFVSRRVFLCVCVCFPSILLWLRCTALSKRDIVSKLSYFDIEIIKQETLLCQNRENESFTHINTHTQTVKNALERVFDCCVCCKKRIHTNKPKYQNKMILLHSFVVVAVLRKADLLPIYSFSTWSVLAFLYLMGIPFLI